MNTVSVNEATAKSGLKVLVHGPAGAGKTRLMLTVPDPSRTLVLSAESGLMSTRGSKLRVWSRGEGFNPGIFSIRDLKQAYKELREDLSSWDWVCLDSISEIAEVVLAEEMKSAKDPRQAYGEMANLTFAMIRAFRDLPLNVYMSAKQGSTDDDGRLLFGPMFPGQQLTKGVAYLFDEVFAMRVERDDEGALRRFLQTSTDTKYAAKDRSGRLELYEGPSLKAIQTKILGDDVENTGDDQ